ncbi:hypothetical protein EVAR_38107_1 [Eumeta japonica]|uniref:Uncharacterized protein n=1 Tax=Eumeta variegata TaxID=151549 RepID=A0A4C1X4I6_EUMVA|nr:hypothetical protein EVAR_38107_1 [Eumeta japonica]
MTPRSRKPLIVTSEQRDNQANTEEMKRDCTHSSETIYQSLSPKNDSDFISSDEENISSQSDDDRKGSVFELNTFLDTKESKVCTSAQKSQYNGRSLTEPFREYLLSRSVLTATPIDLSLLNKTNDMENSNDMISESLMYCLDGNMPSDLTSSIGSLAVGEVMEIEKSNSRSPLKNLNSFVNIDLSSPRRKRTAKYIVNSKHEENIPTYSKRVLTEKENFDFELRETDL